MVGAGGLAFLGGGKPQRANKTTNNARPRLEGNRRGQQQQIMHLRTEGPHLDVYKRANCSL